jgi:hypothetical protein
MELKPQPKQKLVIRMRPLEKLETTSQRDTSSK